FITSNAGTLPRALQKSENEPWMPKAEVEEPKPELQEEVVGTADCQRRTAIAQMELREADGQARRIGVSIDGVMPLATDYPRIGLQAVSEADGTRDIFREADGSGVMSAMQNAEWWISGMAFSGAPSSLKMRYFEGPAQGPNDPGTEFVIDKNWLGDF